jgi:hypothetical protein
MSKNNNVNPGQYKVAGRERQGEQLQQQEDKQALKREQAATERTASERDDAEARHNSPPVREEYPGPQETSTKERIEPGETKPHRESEEDRRGRRQGAS